MQDKDEKGQAVITDKHKLIVHIYIYIYIVDAYSYIFVLEIKKKTIKCKSK